MWSYRYQPSLNELCHYGIKGMKWGIRRYQNYDGSYTKKGLSGYYENEKKYQDAKASTSKTKEDYRSGTATKEQYKNSKAVLKTAKSELSKSYGKLANDKRADKGKKLYQKGKTIDGNNTKAFWKEAAVAVGANTVSGILRKYATTNAELLAANVLTAGSTAVIIAIEAKTAIDNNNLRAYYAH